MTNATPVNNLLLADVRHLIDAARQRVAGAVNAELTQLYWQIGNRINVELLQGQRAEYGKQVIAELAKSNSPRNLAKAGASANYAIACVLPKFSRNRGFCTHCVQN